MGKWPSMNKLAAVVTKDLRIKESVRHERLLENESDATFLTKLWRSFTRVAASAATRSLTCFQHQ